MDRVAGFAHVAVGLVVGRIYGNTVAPARRRAALLAFPLIALLPDLDQLPAALLGISSDSVLGHRGASHAPVAAIAAGLAVWILRGRRPGTVMAALLVTLAVASHGILDAHTLDGRGIALLWPLSSERFEFSWQFIPDAPAGLAFFSRLGMEHLAIELIYFLPLTLYALLPRRRRDASSHRPHPISAYS